MIPELLIFDMDGLLFDTERLFMNLRATVLAKYGYEHREEDYLKTLGVSGKNLAVILSGIYDKDYPAETISRETRALQMDWIEENGLPILPGIQTLLEWAETEAIPCCVATSTQRRFAESFLERSALSRFFAFLVAGDEVTLTKPDPEIFLTACKKAGVSPSRALVLEDSENGILAAANGGIPVLCIPNLKVPDEKTAAKAAAVLKSAEEVIPWLLQTGI